MTRYVECVPNFSEGTRQEVIDAIRDAITAGQGARVLDVSSDRWHNRTVVTYISPVRNAVETAFAAVRASLKLIDINSHTGVHPRIGATDVFPFVPLGGSGMDECIELARSLCERVGSELHVPVYLFEQAALRPDNTDLAQIRRQLRTTTAIAAPTAGPALLPRPDCGPLGLHPTFGAMAIGARPILIAYNIYLGGAENLPVARRVAAAVRESGGGLPGLKALAFLVNAQAQVSMNLVDPERTTMQAAFEAVQRAASRNGAAVTWTEIVGLAPQRMIDGVSREHRELMRDPESRILERRWPPEIRL